MTEVIGWGAVETLEQLKALAGDTPSTTRRPERLPVKSLILCPALFQPRPVSELHVATLLRSVKERGELEPLLVFILGDKPVLIDGHHRVAAYRRAKVTRGVPVRYFEGSPEAAVLEAGNANSRAKLPMAPAERQDYAWRLVLMGSYSKNQIAGAACVAERQVAYMRSAFKELGAEACEYRGWAQARMAWKGRTGAEMTEEEREDWITARRETWASKISRAVGPRFLADVPEAAAAVALLMGRRAPEFYTHFADSLGEFDEWFLEEEEEARSAENPDF